MKRRAFISTGAASMAALYWHRPKPYLMLSGTNYGGADSQGLFMRSADAEKQRSLAIDVHSTLPFQSGFFAFPKNGMQGAYFSHPWAEPHYFASADRMVFSGHGVISPRRDYLITSETNETRSEGRLVVRDPYSGRILDQIPSGGAFPHELLFVDEHTLAASNGGNIRQEQAGLGLIDFQGRKVVEFLSVPEPGMGIRHMILTRDGHLIMGTWTTRGLGHGTYPKIIVKRKNLSLASIDVPGISSRTTQYLSVAYDQSSDYAVVTTTGSDSVIVLHGATQEVRATFAVHQATGVCIADGVAMISSAAGQLHFLDLGTLRWAQPPQPTAMTGSHLTLVRA